MSAVVAALDAGGLVAGGILTASGLVGVRGPARPPSRLAKAVRRAAGTRLSATERRRRHAYALAGAVACGVTWLHTGIPTAGIVAAVMVCAVPWLFGGVRADARAIARLEAIEIWARRLADLVRAGAGLHQAIVASATDPPQAIADDLAGLAADLRGDAATADALRAFADRLADASCDEVVAALILNAHHRGQRLADVLTGIGDGLADLITMRREVASGRSDARISAYVLAGLALGGLTILLANTEYMAPFRSGTGQLVLAACVALIAGCLAWTRRLNTPPRVPRLLAAGSRPQGYAHE